MALAIPLTWLSLMAFMHALEHAPDTASRRTAIDVQVMELPPVSRPPAADVAATTPRPRPAPTRPRVEPVKRAVPPPAAQRPEAVSPSERTPPVEAPDPTPPTPRVESEVPSAPSGAPASQNAIPIVPARPSAPPSSSSGTAALPPESGEPGSRKGVPWGGGRMGARAIYKPLPEIPEALRHQHIATVAVARFRVDANGSADVELIEPTGDPNLNRVLLQSLKRWRFFPGMQDGKPIASNVVVRIPITVR